MSTISDIAEVLAQHGIPDLTSLIDPGATDEYLVSGGRFANAYRGTLHDGTHVAVKVYRQDEAAGKERPGEKLWKKIARELSVMTQLQHPNVLPLMGMVNFRDSPAIVTKWMENGSLVEFVRRNPGANRFQLGMGVCAGLRYLHDSGLVHGDLKAANVLVSDEGIPMITDLDNSVLNGQVSTEQGFDTTTGANLSIPWAAPEMIESSIVSKTRATDVYAYGMTLLEIITGDAPWSGKSDPAIISAIGNYRVPERPSVRLDDVSWELLLSGWAHSPDDRPTTTEIQTRLQAILHNWESSPDKRGSNPWDFLDPSELVEAPTQAPDQAPIVLSEADGIPDSYTVMLKDEIDMSTHMHWAKSLEKRYSDSSVVCKVKIEYKGIKSYSVDLSGEALAAVARSPDVKTLYQNKFMQLNGDVLGPIGNDNAIAVIARGLCCRAVWGTSFGNTPRNDTNGHGTGVANCIIGNLWGVSKTATAIAVKYPDGNDQVQTDFALAGIQWVTDQRVPPLDDIITRAVAQGIHVRAAAVNTSPACVPGVVAVGASSIDDGRWSDSNFGPVLTIFAPGSDIIMATIDAPDSTCVASGTSYAAPYVSGVVAYILAQRGNMGPAFFQDAISGLEIENVLADIGDGSPLVHFC